MVSLSGRLLCQLLLPTKTHWQISAKFANSGGFSVVAMLIFLNSDLARVHISTHSYLLMTSTHFHLHLQMIGAAKLLKSAHTFT
jgi:hypothetical protein